MKRHDWEHNSPTAKQSTCQNCGLRVKTWRIKKGGLGKCLGEQRKLFQKPPCAEKLPPQACIECPGRLNENTCNQLRQLIKDQKPPETPQIPNPA